MTTFIVYARSPERFKRERNLVPLNEEQARSIATRTTTPKDVGSGRCR